MAIAFVPDKSCLRAAAAFCSGKHLLPFSSASICSGVKDVRLRCNLRFSRSRAAESTSEPSC